MRGASRPPSIPPTLTGRCRRRRRRRREWKNKKQKLRNRSSLVVRHPRARALLIIIRLWSDAATRGFATKTLIIYIGHDETLNKSERETKQTIPRGMDSLVSGVSAGLS